MILSELFNRLSIGELSNLAISNDGSGEIVEDKKPKIILYANRALSRLYSKFVLKEGRLILQQSVIRDLYPLRVENSRTYQEANDEGPGFILDYEASPFRGDVLKILSAANEEGEHYHLNKDGHVGSLFTPEPDVLQVPFPTGGQAIGITYQAKHVELAGDETQEVELPSVLEPALAAYIASEVYANMNRPEHQALGVRHLSRFEEICAETETNGIVGESMTSGFSKFNLRGFV